LPCGGNGTCGKCEIITYGSLSPLTETELNKLSSDEIKNNIRLSCLTYAVGDATIDYTTPISNMQGLTDGFIPKFNKNPITSKVDCYGVAIDIGTTTIAAYLYKFPECVCIKTISEQNKQSSFGADVISRIEYSNKGGLEELKETITNQINEILLKFKVEIDTIVITGNTTMLHLYKGLDPAEIAFAPFIPKSLFGEWNNNVYLPSCISSYVGADITTSIIASDMLSDKTSMLIDIGTNGEMAIWNNGELKCCSTAAGPAFEGALIDNGMLAADGAINKVYIEDGKVLYTTINNHKPIGICGTGLIDAIAVMLELGIIEETGYLNCDDEKYYIGDSDIYISAKDVRQVQLGKSAIFAGIETLLEVCNLEYKDIENLYIAGGFGSYIDKYSAGKIGLIPIEMLEKVQIIGNGAGNGAAMILQSKQILEKSIEIAKIAETIELSSSQSFMDKYIDNMMFYTKND
jgi:uncharacterized 2Fe-2S/4Fe-4S cluster protein (DUF4445 family)